MILLKAKDVTLRLGRTQVSGSCPNSRLVDRSSVVRLEGSAAAQAALMLDSSWLRFSQSSCAIFQPPGKQQLASSMLLGVPAGPRQQCRGSPAAG